MLRRSDSGIKGKAPRSCVRFPCSLDSLIFPFSKELGLATVRCMKTSIALLNGPNLNLLGTREPEVYGSDTLQDVEHRVQELAEASGFSIESFQSNHEGAILDQIQAWSASGIRYGILNPGGLTHTSVALRDCISGCSIDFIEVHISHIHRRETFRHHSYTAAACIGQISGLGTYGYEAALHRLIKLANKS